MKNKISAILIFIQLTTLMLFCSCSKSNPCPNTKTTNIPMSADQRSKVPYSGTDTLVFYNQYGDTSYLNGQGINDHFEDWSVGNGDCVRDNTHFEVVRYTYYKDNIKSPFSNLTSIIITNKTFDNYDAWMRINFNYKGDAPFTPYALIDKNFLDSLTIGGKLYKCTHSDNGYPYINEHKYNNHWDSINDKIFYNHYFGILKIVEKDSTIWTRKFN